MSRGEFHFDINRSLIISLSTLQTKQTFVSSHSYFFLDIFNLYPLNSHISISFILLSSRDEIRDMNPSQISKTDVMFMLKIRTAE